LGRAQSQEKRENILCFPVRDCMPIGGFGYKMVPERNYEVTFGL